MDEVWGREVVEIASNTPFPPTASWYTGGNIADKHRQFAVHPDGPSYFETCQRLPRRITRALPWNRNVAPKA